MTLSSSLVGAFDSLIDGRRTRWVPVSDRGLAYGDGVFETIAIRDGRPCRWRSHLERLALGCARLGIEPPSDETLVREARRLTADRDRAVLKILMTRGDSGRGYRPDIGHAGRRILVVHPDPGYPPERHSDGVAAHLCATPASLNPALAGIKHLNRLDNVLARGEWSDPEVVEGIMSASDGSIVGGTMTNLFVWDGRSLATPTVDRCGIAGTVRALAFELIGRLGIPCRARTLSKAELLSAEGIFLTGSLAGVWPICRLGDRTLDPGRLPGPAIRALHRQALTPGEWPS